MWDRAELRVGASDARGLTTGGTISADGKPLEVQPGKGPAASGGQGFFAFLSWDGTGELKVAYAFGLRGSRSEEHTSELQSLMRISYAVFCLKKKNNKIT